MLSLESAHPIHINPPKILKKNVFFWHSILQAYVIWRNVQRTVQVCDLYGQGMLMLVLRDAHHFHVQNSEFRISLK